MPRAEVKLKYLLIVMRLFKQDTIADTMVWIQTMQWNILLIIYLFVYEGSEILQAIFVFVCRATPQSE